MGKALLGTYCSTKVADKFVWRPGVLTQAVCQGSWVLVEDVDTAPSDVMSLLVALAETRTLLVPGHGDKIKAASGFQLFTTQRWLSSHQPSVLMLEQQSKVICVAQLCAGELKEVIAKRFPPLVTMSDKLLNIYFMLSAGRNDAGEASQHTDTHGYFISTGETQLSTRDFMTWCRQSNTGVRPYESVFLEALHYFLACLPKQAMRVSLASAICAKLGLPDNTFQEQVYCTDEPTLKESTSLLELGRAKLPRKPQMNTSRPAPTFSTFTARSSRVLLERVAISVSRNEPVLLSGETGTGKAYIIKFLAQYLGHKLHGINLNEQSHSTDLLGGFKPVDLKFVIMPLREEFETLYCETFSRTQNEKYLSHVQTLFSERRWCDLLTLMETPVKEELAKLESGTAKLERWIKVSKRICELRLLIKGMENLVTFSFIQGTMVKAILDGDWLLLNEINLAPAETLECLRGLLESASGSIVLTERGNSEPIQRHPEFRLFGCMNPATDVGKKELPIGIRKRFTEFFVPECESPRDLSTLVRDLFPGLSLHSLKVSNIIQFYLDIKNNPELKDGTGHKPLFSSRALFRALMLSSGNPCRSVPRSLFEGLCLSFLTQLDQASHELMEGFIKTHILKDSSVSQAVLDKKIQKPESNKEKCINIAGYWISKGSLLPDEPKDYIVTPRVRFNLKNLARVVSARKHAVLIQGETCGKTSLITYLAKLTGNVCITLNNLENTDVENYTGTYIAEHGELVFKEGFLVEPVKKGLWIILEDLNLAPSHFIGVLNRLLDKKELHITATNEIIAAHPTFMLFATQDPPRVGGRKVLSRSLRNKFIELHLDSIPPSELGIILYQRFRIPSTFAEKLVAVLLELKNLMRGSGNQGCMTLRDLFRDLFRWSQRYNCHVAGKGKKVSDWDQYLADHGYMILSGRVRKVEEEAVIQKVLEKHFNRKLNIDSLYTIMPQTSKPVASMLNTVINKSTLGFHHIVCTRSMCRLIVLIGQASRFKEPILLVGDTGFEIAGWKDYSVTVICRSTAICIQSADFFGGLRPVKPHEDSESSNEDMLFEWKDGPLVTAMKEGSMFLIDEIPC